MGEAQQLLLERKLALIDNVLSTIKDYREKVEQNDKQLLHSSKQIIRELQSDLAAER